MNIKVPLASIASPYRDISAPLIKYIKARRAEHGSEVVTVYTPQYIVGHWWETFLHNHKARRIRHKLMLVHGVVIALVPWLLDSSDLIYGRRSRPLPGQDRRGEPMRPRPVPRKPLRLGGGRGGREGRRGGRGGQAPGGRRAPGGLPAVRVPPPQAQVAPSALPSSRALPAFLPPDLPPSPFLPASSANPQLCTLWTRFSAHNCRFALPPPPPTPRTRSRARYGRVLARTTAGSGGGRTEAGRRGGEARGRAS